MTRVFFVDYFKSRGGVDTYSNNLIPQLWASKGIEISLIYVKADYDELFKEVVDNGISKFYYRNDIGLHGKIEDILLINFIKSVLPESSVIFHFNWVNHSSFARLLKKHIKCKTLLTNHCIPWRDQIIFNFDGFKYLDGLLNQKVNLSFVNKRIVHEKIAYSSFDKIICVSQFAKKALEKLLLISDKNIAVIYNGLDLPDNLISEKAYLRKKYGFKESEKILIFAGTIQAGKGIFDLLQSFRDVLDHCVETRLIVAGEGNFSKLLEGMQDLWSKVVITGRVDKQTLFNFYRLSDIGIVPSHIEQCSYSAIEMMLHKLPIIVSKIDGLKEIVGEQHGLKVPLLLDGKVPTLDLNILTHSILRYLNDPTFAKNVADLCYENAKEQFSSEKMAMQTLGTYENLTITKDVKWLNDEDLKPLVSIVLVLSSDEPNLTQCLESIVNQYYKNFELFIILNSDSTKNSQIIDYYTDTRINRISLNTNIAEILNYVLTILNGDYFVYANPKNTFHIAFLEKIILKFYNEKDLNVGMIGCQQYEMDQYDNVINIAQFPMNNEEIFINLFFESAMPLHSTIIRMDLLKKYKFDDCCVKQMMQPLWFWILKNRSALNVSEVLCYSKPIGINENKRDLLSICDFYSDKLDEMNVCHSVSELTTHVAIYQKCRGVYFNNSKRALEANHWVERVLNSLQEQLKFDDNLYMKTKVYILEHLCGISHSS